MIVFHKVRFKNFMAYGNAMQEVNLLGNGKVLITGKNGHGKSAIGEAIYFALYGKPFRKIKKDELVNSINKKGLLVEIEFSVNGKDVVIRRGIKPNVLEVFVDGKQMDKDASVLDQQKYIERNLLGINDKSFRQIVLLGSDMYVPFMLLPAAERRKFIDNLMDTNVYTVMSDVAKGMLGDEKLVISKLTTELDRIGLTIQERKARLQDLNEMYSEAVDTLQEEVKQKETVLEKITEKGKQLKKALQEYNRKKEAAQELKAEISALLAKKKDMSSEVNDVCPMCKRPFDKEHVEQHRKELKTIEEKLQELKEQYKEYENLDDSVVGEYHRVVEQYKNTEASIKQLQERIAELSSEQDNGEKVNALETQILELQEQHKQKEKELDLANKRAVYIEQFVQMLKDDGIRGVVVDKYLPTINSLIHHYLEVLDFDIFFEFDQNFNERIVKRGKEFSYRQLSAGQRLRIDLCLLFTWRDLARMRNQANTNLVIFDEIGSSTLDAEGVQAFIDLLASHDDNDTSIVISHNETISPYFDKHWHVEMKGAFSQIHGA